MELNDWLKGLLGYASCIEQNHWVEKLSPRLELGRVDRRIDGSPVSSPLTAALIGTGDLGVVPVLLSHRVNIQASFCTDFDRDLMVSGIPGTNDMSGGLS